MSNFDDDGQDAEEEDANTGDVENNECNAANEHGPDLTVAATPSSSQSSNSSQVYTPRRPTPGKRNRATPTHDIANKLYKIATDDKEHDEDELFCLSLVPSFRKLSDEKKMRARIDVQQVLMSARFDNAICTPPPQPVVARGSATQTRMQANEGPAFDPWQNNSNNFTYTEMMNNN